MTQIRNIVDSKEIWAAAADCVQDSGAVARRPRDAAAILFGLKFAGNIHYLSLRVYSQASKATAGFRAPNIPAQNRI